MFINEGFPTLFIKDILLHTTLLSTVKPGWFRFKNMCFKSVRVRGTISEAFKYPDKWKIVIDDGTGTIICYYMDYKKELDKRDEVSKLKNRIQQRNQTDSCVIPILNNCLNKMQFVVHEYKAGETVEITGNLREYNEKLIFASRVVIDKFNDVDKEIEYVRSVNNFYKEIEKLQ